MEQEREPPDLRDFVQKRRPKEAAFLEQKLWDLAAKAPLGWHLIGSEDDPYLLRIYISPREPEFKWLWNKVRRHWTRLGEFDASLVQSVPHLYLHHFFRGDADVELHNHPWSFALSFILTGGYIEERWDLETQQKRIRHVYPGSFNTIRSSDFHRVILRKPDRGCWSLFLTRDRINDKDGHNWGFLNVETGAYTAWGPFTRAKEAEASRG